MFSKKFKNEYWNFMVDTHAYCTHFIIDRSIIREVKIPRFTGTSIAILFTNFC
jgi:hypothetical protein